MNLFTIGSNTVTLNYVSGTVGQLKINNTGSANIELFDGGWTSVILKTNSNNPLNSNKNGITTLFKK